MGDEASLRTVLNPAKIPVTGAGSNLNFPYQNGFACFILVDSDFLQLISPFVFVI
jgi:hypothetical protein